MGKAVWGKVKVAFNSGAGDIGTPWCDEKILNIQCRSPCEEDLLPGTRLIKEGEGFLR
jgi:hypothetical protein